MKKVIFINSWGENPEVMLHRYKKQTPGNLGVWKDIEGTTSISQADYCVILGGNPDAAGFNLSKSIYVRREPDFIEKPFTTGFDHNILWKDGHCGVTWWLNKTYDELKNLEYPNKEKLASCIVSSKHRHRVDLVQKIFGTDTHNIDLYGRGHNPHQFGAAYRGEIAYDGNCKFLGLYPYQWSVVLENSQQPNYWTEKIADAYLSWCMPIYWGCPNIEEYFETDSYCAIDIHDTNPRRTVQKILESPLTERQINALKKARTDILDTYNIWEIVRNKIQEIENEIL